MVILDYHQENSDLSYPQKCSTKGRAEDGRGGGDEPGGQEPVRRGHQSPRRAEEGWARAAARSVGRSPLLTAR